MDNEEIMSKIIEIGRKVINLRDEIKTNVQILAENEQFVSDLMKDLGKDEVKNALEEVMVKRNVKKVQSFDSKEFKKAHPKTYEEYRVVSKRFNQKKLKEAKPDLFNKFNRDEEVVSISIERYIPEESLPSL